MSNTPISNLPPMTSCPRRSMRRRTSGARLQSVSALSTVPLLRLLRS